MLIFILKLFSWCRLKYIYIINYLTALRHCTCSALCSSVNHETLLATKQEKCLSFLSLYCFSFLITTQESSKYFCLSLKPETCWYYYIVANANTVRYLSKQSNLKHSKEIVKGHHSKHLNQTLPLRGSLTTGEKATLQSL